MDPIEATIDFEDPPVVQRDDHRAFPEETSSLIESIARHDKLSVLHPGQQRYLASLMRREPVAKDSRIVVEGQDPVLIWCCSGELTVKQAGFFGESDVLSLLPGEFFGVEDLQNDRLSSFSVVVTPSVLEDCVVWSMEKDSFNESVKEMLERRTEMIPAGCRFLKVVPLVRDLDDEVIRKVVCACVVERFSEGQTVFKMGFHGEMLCFVYKGEAVTLKPQPDGTFLQLATQVRGEYFGEMALIRNTRRTASVVAKTELVLLCLSKEYFEEFLSPLKEKMAAKAAASYKRQDDAPADDNTPESGVNSATSGDTNDRSSGTQFPTSRSEAEAIVQKRTRKSSLALRNYTKIRDQERQQAGVEGGDSPDSAAGNAEARWRLAPEPKVLHSPSPSDACPKRSCIKSAYTKSKSKGIKLPVKFDSDTLLPGESDDEVGG